MAFRFESLEIWHFHRSIHLRRKAEVMEDRISQPVRSFCRRLAICYVVSAIFASFCWAEQWYEAYDTALKAVENGNWQLAEEKLKLALKQQPNQGKKVRAYGTFFIRYIPDYYLGVVYLNQGKYQEALAKFQLVQDKELVVKGDSEFSQLTKLTISAQKNLPGAADVTAPKTTIENLKAKEQQIAKEVTVLLDQTKDLISQGRLEDARKSLKALQEKDPKSPSLVELTSEIQKKEVEQRAKLEKEKSQNEVTNLVNQARQAITSRNYSFARKLMKEATAAGLDDRNTKELQKSIDLAENLDSLRTSVSEGRWSEAERVAQQVKVLDPQNMELKKIEGKIQNGLAGMKTEPLEREGMLAFYSGQYEQAVELLERVTAAKNHSARAHFYLGCSNAALGLLKGKEGDVLLSKARQQFSQARRMAPELQYDKRFISPRILQLYAQAQ